MMSQSNSSLLNYLSLLLSSDEALNKFTVDPITEAEETYGLTKAERAVLRRTVAHLSSKAVNGFTMARHLGSYRRSLRLLQNVLHNVGSKMVQDTMTISSSTDEQLPIVFPFSVICNYPSVSSPVDFSCEPNSTVESSSYGGPYANSTPSYTVFLPNPHPTIEDVMKALSNKLPYTTVTLKDINGNTEPYIISFTPSNSSEITADLSNSCYDLGPGLNPDYVFWFWSINGKANPNNSGSLAESFATHTLNPFDTVFWQLIAPDQEYGFYPCSPTEGNAYAINSHTKTS